MTREPGHPNDAALRYLSGFGNEHTREALPGALPIDQNSPPQCPYGLYAEQLSGTAFTAPRHHSRRSWLYRIRPSSMHQPFQRIDDGRLVSDFDSAPDAPRARVTAVAARLRAVPARSEEALRSETQVTPTRAAGSAAHWLLARGLSAAAPERR